MDSNMSISEFFYGVPVVGHGLACMNALVGNEKEAKKALKAANRTTCVIAGGMGGAVIGGPVGMVAGAVATGTAMDAASSVANGRPEGVIRGAASVVDDLENGRVPVTSTILTSLYVAGDVLSGVTGGNIASQIPQSAAVGIASALAKETGTQISEAVVKEIVTTGAQNAVCSATTRTLANNIDHDGADSCNTGSPRNSTSYTSDGDRSYTQSNPRNQSETDGTSPGGQEPPRNNKNKFKSEHERDADAPESHFLVFCRLFDQNITSLNDIQIEGVYLFREITGGSPTDRGRKNSLKKLISSLRNNKIKQRVINTVKRILSTWDRSDVTFQNFLCLTEMVATHVCDNLARRHEMQIDRFGTTHHQVRAMNMFFNIFYEKRSINSIYNELRNEISRYWSKIEPTFGNQVTAITHYYKHKFIPASARILSVKEYFNLISSVLTRVRESSQYQELVRGTRRRLVYDVYRIEFRRRVRLVLQIQNGKIVVSSCHILDVIINFDENEGDEEFDPSY